jgi:hypothetical protein
MPHMRVGVVVMVMVGGVVRVIMSLGVMGVRMGVRMITDPVRIIVLIVRVAVILTGMNMFAMSVFMQMAMLAM